MALQYSTTLRNAQLDSIESTVGASPKLQLRTGSPPATCATADSGTLVCEITLPSDWMQAAASGSKALNGTWSGTASVGGTIGHFRIKDAGGTTTHLQGTVTAAGGGGDAIADSVTVSLNQGVSVTGFTVSAGNA